MSAPVVSATAQWDSAATAVTQVKATMPAGIIAGQLIVVFVARVGANSVGSANTGWTALGSAAGASTLDGGWFWKVADGSETGDVNLSTLAVADRCGTQTYVISNWNNGVNPAAGTWSTPSSSLAPNPPLLTSGFGAVDTLWIEGSIIGGSSGRTMTASTSYTNALQGASTGVGNMSYATARRTTTAASEDPAAVAWSGAAAQSAANVIAISGVIDKAGTAETFSFSDASAATMAADIQVTDAFAVADASTDREFVTFNDPWVFVDSIGDRELSASDAFGVDDIQFGQEHVTSDSFAFAEGPVEITVGWHTGHLHVSKFDPGDPQYTIENEILDYDQIADGDRVNVVVIDGNIDSWTQYDRDDLITRDRAVNRYLDMPELKSSGEVRQRAIDELAQARRANSPGGSVVWQPRYTIKDSIWWVDEDAQRYTATIEGLDVEFNMGTEPFQRASIDNGNVIICDEDTGDITYAARDLFERSGDLGDAITGGTWVTY